MFDLLTICYLFLGGAGSGALVVLSLLECANARRRFGWMQREARLLGASYAGRRTWGTNGGFDGLGFGGSYGGSYDGSHDDSARANSLLGGLARSLMSRFALPDEFFARAWPVCFVTLALAVLCLLFELGRPDRLANLLTSPTFSPISIGAYALVLALACATWFSAVALFENAWANAAIVGVTAVMGVVVGLVAAAYTGVLLSGLASVLFWQTAWLPATFVFSSLSCGVACVFLAAAFVEVRQVVLHPFRALAYVDSVLIVLEAVCLVGLVAHGFAGEGARLSAEALTMGEFRWLFWGGLVILGLAVPLVMERYVVHGNYSTQLMFVAVLVLLGGFVLRWCVVGVAAYDVTQMPRALYGFAM